MKKFTGLGRGLDALIDTSRVDTNGGSSISEIALSQIIANPDQPRRTFDEEALEELEGDEVEREVSVATGRLAYPFLKEFADQLNEKYPNTKVYIYPIRNDFFGEMITVSGLITGQDLRKQLKERMEEIVKDEEALKDINRKIVALGEKLNK